MQTLGNRSLSWILEKKSHAILVLWLLIIAVFFQVLEADFVDFDEQETILSNPAVTASFSIESLKNIFTSFSSNQYTPLSIASHWLEYNLVGFNSAFSHLINLLLHLLGATAVFLLGHSLFGSTPQALLAAAFWAVHPLQVDTVAWILERRNLLFGMFFFASMMSYAHYVDSKKRLHLALATACVLLSGISKTLAFFLPFFWLLIDWVKERPLSARLLSEKWLGWILSAILLYLLFAGALDGIPVNNDRFLKWDNASYAIGFYAAKTIFPSGLTPTFEENASTVGLFDRGFLYLFFFLIIAGIMSRGNRAIFAGFIFYLCNIIPLSGLIRVGYPFYVSCHFVYVAFWGLIMALGFWFRDVASLYVSPKKLWGAGLLTLLLMSGLSFAHSSIWKNSITLFEYALKVDPDGKFSRNQLAGAFIKEKRYEDAELHYTELTKRYPDFYSGYNGLGLIFSRRGEYARARGMFDKAIERGEREAVSLRNRGMLRFAISDFQGAEEDLTRSIANDPHNLKTRFHRVELRARCGQYGAAIEDIVEIVSRQPGNLSPAIRWFELLLESGEYYSAMSVFFTLTAPLGLDQQRWNFFWSQVFFPGPSEFFTRTGPFRSLIRHRFGWYPF